MVWVAAMAAAPAGAAGRTIQMVPERLSKPVPQPKGKTRLEVTMERTPITKIDEKTFKAAVWARDKGHCRCCLRKVIKTIARVPERGDVHHIHGRTGDLRFESRAALLVCARDHERLTGKVNAHRLVIHPTQTFLVRQGRFIDATFPVTFKELV